MVNDVTNNVATFGELVKKKREEKGLSIHQLSRDLDGEISVSYLSRIESGKKQNPTFVLTIKLVEELDIPLEDVLESFGFSKELLTGKKSENGKEAY